MFEIISIIIPVAIQKVIAASNPLLDNFMIGGLGTAAVAAVGSANKFMGLLRLFLIGISSANGILTSQFNSESNRDREIGIARSLILNIAFSLIASLIFYLTYVIFNKNIISSFSSDILVQKLAKDYLSIAIFSAIPLSIIFSLSTTLRSIKKVYFLLVATVIFISTNVFFNKALIYGNYGFSPMGVKGAALATFISEVLAVFLVVVGIIMFKYPIFNIKSILNIPYNFVKKYLNIAIPLSITWFLWSLFLVVTHNMIGTLGREALAAYGIISPIETFVSNLFAGFGSAALILIGRELGENNFDKAYEKAKQISLVGISIAAFIGLVMHISSGIISSIYDGKISPVAIKYVSQMIKIYSMFLFIRVFNSISYNGIFASGGDSKFIFSMSMGIFWLLVFPILYIGINYFNFTLMKIYLIMNLAEVLTSIAFLIRFKSKKWLNNLIK